MTARFRTDDLAQRERGLSLSAAALRRGQLVGIPVDTTYGIATDAFSERGTDDLRVAKGRPDLMIPVMVPRIATVSGIAQVGLEAAELMRGFWPGPLTLILRSQPTLSWSVGDRSGRVAVRMPLHPVALELLGRTGPLGVVTGSPGAITVDDAFGDEILEHLAIILDAGILPGGPASAVVDLTGDTPRVVRPGPIDLAELVAVCPRAVHPGAQSSASERALPRSPAEPR